MNATDCKLLIVRAEVRYWEDSTFDGVEDSEEGEFAPFKSGVFWNPIIDLDSGKIVNWPQGTVAAIHYKVCDQGEYWLADASAVKLAKWKGSYVPDKFLCHGDEGFGDYIIFAVNENGKIQDYTKPEINAEQWEAIQ